MVKQPIIGRDQALEGIDCLASGMTKAGHEQVGNAGSDHRGRVCGEARKGWHDQGSAMAGDIVVDKVAKDYDRLAPRAAKAIVEDVAAVCGPSPP